MVVVDSGIPNTFEEALDQVWAKSRKVMIERQRKYGPNNITRHGEQGIVVRLDDKIERLMNQMEFADDTHEDGWIDVCNYALIAQMLLRGIWGLPLEESDEQLTVQARKAETHTHTYNGMENCNNYHNCGDCHCHLQDEAHTACCKGGPAREFYRRRQEHLL